MSDPVTQTTPTVPGASDVLDFLAKVNSLAGYLSATFAPGATVQTTTGNAVSATEAFLSAAGQVVGIFFPGASVAGFAVSKAIALAAEVAQQAPTAVAAVQAIQAAVDGGVAPTPEEWAALDAAADTAHARLQASIAAYLADQPPPPVPPAA